MSEIISSEILEEMAQYYRERASEYDDWFYRRGRYNDRPETNPTWFAEVDEVFAALDALHLEGDILEIAPGTGIWTERLLRYANSITAVDASTEMMALNRARLGSDRVTYMQADIFAWQPARTYDAVSFSFWISHVPLDRLPAFLHMVATALKPGGKIFFVDGRHEPMAADQSLAQEGKQLKIRALNDGRTFQIVKNYYDPAWLAARCKEAGLDVTVCQTATYLLYGCGSRPDIACYEKAP